MSGHRKVLSGGGSSSASPGTVSPPVPVATPSSIASLPVQRPKAITNPVVSPSAISPSVPAVRPSRVSYSSSSSSTSTSSPSTSAKNSISVASPKSPAGGIAGVARAQKSNRKPRPSASQSQSQSQSSKSNPGHQHNNSNSFARFQIRPSVSESGIASEGGSGASSASTSRRESLSLEKPRDSLFSSRPGGIIDLEPVHEIGGLSASPSSLSPRGPQRRHSVNVRPVSAHSSVPAGSGHQPRTSRTFSVTGVPIHSSRSASASASPSSGSNSNSVLTSPTIDPASPPSGPVIAPIPSAGSPRNGRLSGVMSVSPAIPIVTTSGGLLPSAISGSTVPVSLPSSQSRESIHPPPPSHPPPPPPNQSVSASHASSLHTSASPSLSSSSTSSSNNATVTPPGSAGPGSLPLPSHPPPPPPSRSSASGAPVAKPQSQCQATAGTSSATPAASVSSPSSLISPSAVAAAAAAASAAASSNPALHPTSPSVAIPVVSPLSHGSSLPLSTPVFLSPKTPAHGASDASPGSSGRRIQRKSISASGSSLAAPNHRRSASNTPRAVSPNPGGQSKPPPAASSGAGLNSSLAADRDAPDAQSAAISPALIAASASAPGQRVASQRRESMSSKRGSIMKRSGAVKSPDSAPSSAPAPAANSSAPSSAASQAAGAAAAAISSASGDRKPRTSTIRRLGYYDQLFLRNTGLSESDPIAAISYISGSKAAKEAAAVAREKENQDKVSSPAPAVDGDVTYVVDNDWNVDLEISAREASLSSVQRAKSIALGMGGIGTGLGNRRDTAAAVVGTGRTGAPPLTRPATMAPNLGSSAPAHGLSRLSALSDDEGDGAIGPNRSRGRTWFDDSSESSSEEENQSDKKPVNAEADAEPQPVDLSFLDKNSARAGKTRSRSLGSRELETLIGSTDQSKGSNASQSQSQSPASSDTSASSVGSARGAQDDYSSLLRSKSISNLNHKESHRSSLTVRVGKSSLSSPGDSKGPNLLSLFKSAFESVSGSNVKKPDQKAPGQSQSPPPLQRPQSLMLVQPSRSPQSAPGPADKGPKDAAEAADRLKNLPSRSFLSPPNSLQSPPSPGGGRRRFERRRSSSVHMFARRGSAMMDIQPQFNKEKNDPATVNSMATYVPRMVINRLTKTGYIGTRNGSADHIQEMASSKAKARLGIGVANHQPESYTLRNAAILIADVSGFTRLNEMLASRDSVHAAETMTNHLNKYFSSILDIIDAHNGDCVKFAGDALIVLFAAPSSGEEQDAPKEKKSTAAVKMNRMISSQLESLPEEDGKMVSNPALNAPKEFAAALSSENASASPASRSDMDVTRSPKGGPLSPRLSTIFSAPDSATEFIDDILAATPNLISLRNAVFDSGIIVNRTTAEGIFLPKSVTGAALVDFLVSSQRAKTREEASELANSLYNVGMRDCKNPFCPAADRLVEDSNTSFYTFNCSVKKEEIPKVLEKLEDRRAGAVASLTAVQCGLALQEKVGIYKPTEDVELSLHIAVAGGNVFAMHLGGFENELEFVLAGQPFSQLSNGLDASGTGDVVVSADTWDAIHHFCHGTVVTESHKSKQPITSGEVLIKHVCSPLPILLPTPEQLAKQAAKQLTIGPALRAYVPRSVLIKLDAAQDQWLAELRTASIIFVNLHGLVMSTRNSHDPSRPDEILRAMQKIISHNRGYRRQFLCDDKGTTLIIVFGVPPAAHEDDAIRSIRTALELREKLLSMDVAHSIGIASGNVYVGSVGSSKRQEHAVVGDVVNLAARLSGHKSDLGIVVDKYTMIAASSKINFQAMGEIKVKGKANLIKIFTPLMINKIANIDASGQILGRRNETMTFMEELVKLQKPPKSSSKADIQKSRAPIIWIEGTAGVGKSALARNFYRLAKVNVPTIFIAAEATDRSRPFAIWSHILEEILGLTNEMNGDMRRDRVNKFAKVSLKPKHQPLLPLLNDILQLKLPENKVTSKLRAGGPDKESQGLTDLLVRIVKAHQNEKYQAISSVSANSNKDKKFVRPMCWIIEDVHNVDSASMNQLISVWESKKTRMLMILTSRNVSAAERNSSVYQRLKNLQNPAMVFIPLGGLDRENLTRLVSQRLQVPQLPSSLAELIHSKAKGNPLYAAEIAEALKESGYFDIKHGQIYMNENIENKEMAIPSSLKSLLIRRIDRLPPKDILVVKLASVLGGQFNRQALQLIYEKEGGLIKDLDACLGDLEIAQIIEERGPGVYSFLHSMVQQACYELLLLSQRTRLHLAIAEWYEKQGAAFGVVPPVIHRSRSASLSKDADSPPGSGAGSPSSTRSSSVSSAPSNAAAPAPTSSSPTNEASNRSSLSEVQNKASSGPAASTTTSSPAASAPKSISISGNSPVAATVSQPQTPSKSLISQSLLNLNAASSFNFSSAPGALGFPNHLIDRSSHASSGSSSPASAIDTESAVKSGVLCPGETFNGVLYFHFIQACKQPENLDFSTVVKGIAYLDAVYCLALKNGAMKESSNYIEKCDEIWKSMKSEYQTSLLNHYQFEILNMFRNIVRLTG